jgi:hypothetical protein
MNDVFHFHLHQQQQHVKTTHVLFHRRNTNKGANGLIVEQVRRTRNWANGSLLSPSHCDYVGRSWSPTGDMIEKVVQDKRRTVLSVIILKL